MWCTIDIWRKPVFTLYYREYIQYLKSTNGWLPAIFCFWNVPSKGPAVIHHTGTPLALVLLFNGGNVLVNIYTFQRDTQCSSTDWLLMHRCQLYMFRTVTVHPQELLFRCCMCRLWYVVRNAPSGMSCWCTIAPAGCTRWGVSYDIP